MDFNIINQNGIDYISAMELQIELRSIEKFASWIKRLLQRAYLKENKDFVCSIKQSTGGRRQTDYLLTAEASQRIAIVANTKKSQEIIDYLIDLSKKRSNLELVTVKEAAYAIKVINCLKFIVNQKEAYALHKTSFVQENNDRINPKYIFNEFAKYRAQIVGWDKDKTNKAIDEFLNEHSGYPRNKMQKLNMQTQLSVMDIGEAIRVSVLDILYANHANGTLAENFSNLCKNMAKEMQIEPDKENTRNLFKDKEQIENVKSISLISVI